MKAIGTKVIVRVEKQKTGTQKVGALEIPVGAEEYWKAEVISVGDEVKPESLKPGDKIYMYLGAGKAFRIDGVEYQAISTSEIIVVL